MKINSLHARRLTNIYYTYMASPDRPSAVCRSIRLGLPLDSPLPRGSRDLFLTHGQSAGRRAQPLSPRSIPPPSAKFRTLPEGGQQTARAPAPPARHSTGRAQRRDRTAREDSCRGPVRPIPHFAREPPPSVPLSAGEAGGRAGAGGEGGGAGCTPGCAPGAGAALPLAGARQGS